MTTACDTYHHYHCEFKPRSEMGLKPNCNCKCSKGVYLINEVMSNLHESIELACFTQSLLLCVMFCRSLFVLLAIALSVLPRFTDSELPLWYLKTLLNLAIFD